MEGWVVVMGGVRVGWSLEGAPEPPLLKPLPLQKA